MATSIALLDDDYGERGAVSPLWSIPLLEPLTNWEPSKFLLVCEQKLHVGFTSHFGKARYGVDDI